MINEYELSIRAFLEKWGFNWQNNWAEARLKFYRRNRRAIWTIEKFSGLRVDYLTTMLFPG